MGCAYGRWFDSMEVASDFEIDYLLKRMWWKKKTTFPLMKSAEEKLKRDFIRRLKLTFDWANENDGEPEDVTALIEEYECSSASAIARRRGAVDRFLNFRANAKAFMLRRVDSRSMSKEAMF